MVLPGVECALPPVARKASLAEMPEVTRAARRAPGRGAFRVSERAHIVTRVDEEPSGVGSARSGGWGESRPARTVTEDREAQPAERGVPACREHRPDAGGRSSRSLPRARPTSRRRPLLVEV